MIEFLAAGPSPSGGRLAAAGLLMMAVAARLGRWNQPKLCAAAVRAIQVCRRGAPRRSRRLRRRLPLTFAPCCLLGPSLVIFVEWNEFDFGYAECGVEGRLPLDAEGLQRNGVIRPAYQHVCPPAHAE